MENIMNIICIANIGKMLKIPWEKLYIYKETTINNHINDKFTVKPNIIFDTLILKDTDRAHITL
jgi:hypothetical protein